MKKNKDIKRRWILAILWMAFIFVMSQMPGERSNEQSKLVIYVFSFLGIDLNSIWGDLANYIIRKGAHFTEYFILYILIIIIQKLIIKMYLIMKIDCYNNNKYINQYYINIKNYEYE